MRANRDQTMRSGARTSIALELLHASPQARSFRLIAGERTYRTLTTRANGSCRMARLGPHREASRVRSADDERRSRPSDLPWLVGGMWWDLDPSARIEREAKCAVGFNCCCGEP